MAGFQEVISQFVHGVYVVGSCDGKALNGMTAAWVSQVSLSPTMVMVAIAPERYTYDLIKKTGKFSLSQLHQGQLNVAKAFGFESGRNKDKFEGIDYDLVEGLPVLKDCLSWVVSLLEGEYKAGDHYILVGRVIAGGIKKKATPLLFKWEDYF